MISAKFYDALELVLYIAINYQGEPIGSKKICDSQGCTARNLEPLLQALVQSNILKGTKGPKGGYSLAKEKRKISLYDIYNSTIPSATYKNQQKNYIHSKIIIPLSNKLNKSIEEQLKTTTLEKLCPKSQAIVNSSDDFYI